MNLFLKYACYNYFIKSLLFFTFLILQNCIVEPFNEASIKITEKEIRDNIIIKTSIGSTDRPIPIKFNPNRDSTAGILLFRFYKVYGNDFYLEAPLQLNELTGKFYNTQLEEIELLNNGNDKIAQQFYPKNGGGAWYIWSQVIWNPYSLNDFNIDVSMNHDIKKSTHIEFSNNWPYENIYNAKKYSSKYSKNNKYVVGANLNKNTNFLGKINVHQRCLGDKSTGPIKETRFYVSDYSAEREDGQFKKIQGKYLLKKTILEPPLFFYHVAEVYYSSFYHPSAQDQGHVTFSLECVYANNSIREAKIVKNQKFF